MTKLAVWGGLGVLSLVALGAATPPAGATPTVPNPLPQPSQLLKVTVACPATIAAYSYPLRAAPALPLTANYPAAAVSSGSFDGTTLTCHYTPAPGSMTHVDSVIQGTCTASPPAAAQCGRLVVEFPTSLSSVVNPTSGSSYGQASLQAVAVLANAPSSGFSTATASYNVGSSGFASVGMSMPTGTTGCTLTDAVKGVVTCTRVLVP